MKASEALGGCGDFLSGWFCRFMQNQRSECFFEILQH